MIESNGYWMNKLAPFRRGSGHFRTRDRCSDSVRYFPAEPVGISQDADQDLVISALALLWFRYVAASEILVAQEKESSQFFYRICHDPDESIHSFRGRVRAEMEETAEHAGYAIHDAGVGFEVALCVSRKPLDEDAPYALGVITAAGGPVRLWFDSHRFAPDLANQLAEHYSRAFCFLADAAASSTLRQLDLLSFAQRAQLLAFNRTVQDYSRPSILHRLVEGQAERTPNAVAIVYHGKQLTYSELNGRANRLALFLSELLHVRSGELVGLVVPRSEMMIVAILGILKAGAGYLPIDPRHPVETVNYMLRNAGIQALVVSSDTAGSAAGFQGPVFFLDIEFPELPSGAGNPAKNSADSDPAYVIYTSGSTGRPKGVEVSHRSIVNTVLWRNGYYGMDERDVNLQMPSYSFDSSVVDIFCSLTSGGRLVIPKEELRLDVQYLRNIIQAEGVTRFLATPSYYRVLVKELRGISGMRSITLAGENVTLELVASHFRYLPAVRLVNEYGPTENAVCSTACDLTDSAPVVHIGGPIANTQVFVMDSDLRLVPIGASGEIYVAGAGLAIGYINAKNLTEERFLPCSVPEFPGRMYSTGDRGRWRTDGTLEFIGRVDNQIKVRGFRVELNEIECCLLEYPGVDAAAVLCRQNGSDDKYLAAYVASPQPLTRSELSAWMKQRLPYYMLPDIVHVMARMPLTLNGKVDSAALVSLPDFPSFPGARGRTATPIEERLAALCAAVFQRGDVAPEDNFFDAFGASSLNVMQIVTAVHFDLGASIELQDIYARPTVRDLAEIIGRPRTAKLTGGLQDNSGAELPN